ncbi:MAG TPA: pyridoxal 5'-phosphate synthase glutaminase subunit PdxT [Thermoanaerobaculia bacterium]|nr:pyridoxal 5'-phosphate synthase glutaminase subunit PdxT [Thermoanaerobaculia bacterium]
MKVGVLALQGDFDAHRRRLAELGAEAPLVRQARELDDVDALVIPGGESTTFVKLMEGAGRRGRGAELFDALREFVAHKPVFGTCAGAILLARGLENSTQPTLGALDIRVRRNAYGRQLESSIRRGEFQGAPMEMVFIRAPKIVSFGSEVEVLAREGDDAVAVRQGHVVAATFHPELSEDMRMHALFLEMI